MSLQSWKEEFYPSNAADEFQFDPTPQKELVIKAIEHSLKKWIGLSPENLKKHDAYRRGVDQYETSEIISDGSEKLCTSYRQRMWIGSSSCSLCQVYDEICQKCIFTTTLKMTCKSQYARWVNKDENQPMVESLQEILKIVKGEDSQ